MGTLERLAALDVFPPATNRRITMISRTIVAAVFAIGTGSAALAQVEVNTPRAHVKVPGGGVDLNVKVGSDKTPTDAWIGRDIYSTDGEHLGEVTGIALNQVYADIGGFLGIGETRVALAGDSIQAVQDDRIVLKLTEAEAGSLPAIDAQAGAPN
jgi:sporulation protein YlmC with PRC-barrel domain